ncbi:hypothetical protein GCM10017655_24280 [Pseudomonas turukhanskensis]|uniref:Uncharacterized protein n=1 Tax=Pseudomonas turukhanskensis TaxID=1806536 RepID=A0A9W6NG55_9PSED|nr:hypothetical protein GCM10017655_24280 [Pseudomonas turukhanskensis]
MRYLSPYPLFLSGCASAQTNACQAMHAGPRNLRHRVGARLPEGTVDRPENDRAKPANWSDGVREPRVILGPLPNRNLLAHPEKTARAPRVVEQRAANQPFVAEPDAGALASTAQPLADES